MMHNLKIKFATALVLYFLAATSFAVNNSQKIFIFFYSSHCHYCHEMADILFKIQQKHKIKLIANSLDGKEIKQFPNASHNIDLVRKFNITSTPTIVVVDIENKTFEVVSFELESHKLLEAKMLAVLND